MSRDEQEAGGGFLKRWSRVKTSGEEAQEAPLPVIDADEVETESEISDSQTESTPEKILTDADMPPLESLTEGSDFSGFLSKGVSEALRKAAFKKMFSQPSFNIRDGLDDYDEDYTSFVPLGDTVTADMTYRANADEKREAAKKALLMERTDEQEQQVDEPADVEHESSLDMAEEEALDENTAKLIEHEVSPELTDQQESPDDSSHDLK